MIIGDNMNNIIGMYKIEDLDKTLSDINELRALWHNAINIRNNLTDDSKDRCKMRAIELHMKELVISSNMLNDQRLENYKKVLREALDKDPTYIFDSEVLKVPKERLLGIMNEDIYNRFSRYKGALNEYCSNVYNRLVNNQVVTPNEKRVLMGFLCSNVGTRDKTIYEMQEVMMSRIINGVDNCDYHDARFLAEFIAQEEAKEYGYEVVTDVASVAGENREARGYASQYRVCIKAAYILEAFNGNDNERKARVIHTICHEVAHTKQNDDIIHGVCNKDTLDILSDKIFRLELSEKDFVYYRANYYFEAGEKDAEKKGFVNADKYIQKYLNGEKEKERIHNFLLDRKDHEIYVDSISMRKDSSLEKVDADKFRIEKMEEILKRDNSYLTRFPQFRHLYKENGELKSFADRLISYTDFKKVHKEDSPDIFLTSFNYSLDKGDLEEIDFVSLGKEKAFKVIHALSDLYNTYRAMAHNTLESVRQKDGFLTGEKDITNAGHYRDEKVRLMASRYEKLEIVLDSFYAKYAEEYTSIEAYSSDKFIYDNDKQHVRDKYNKIQAIRKEEIGNKNELAAMIQEGSNQVITDEDKINK